MAAPVLVTGRATASTTPSTADVSEPLSNWSSPDTWGGSVPGAADVVRISKPIRLDVDAHVKGLVIEPEGSLTFDPTRSVTLACTGNVEVYGTLEMRPESHRQDHLLVFPSIDEAQFVGGGMDVMATDVGLWVKDCGRLLVEGTPRTAWVRATAGLRAGATSLRLRAVPEGWRPGDQLVITPTGSPADDRHYDGFDEVRIAHIADDVVTLDRPLRFSHPRIHVGDGTVMTAEVLNLTRNVRIEGTPNGRMHTWIHTCCDTSLIRYASLRHFGPRQADGKYTTDVLGRYGLHFHMTGDCSRGTVVEGVVARDGGAHAFVPHTAHGITMRSCISYNTYDDAYWWDKAASTRDEGPPTNDLLLDSCVAAKVRCDPSFRGQRLSGFFLGAGSGSIARHCVSVGVQGNKSASGFQWPELSHGLWTFESCVAHNNKVHGIFVWQNTNDPHVISEFIGYHNGGFGVSHGAYRNGYRYVESILYGNLAGGMEVHATSHSDVVLTLRDVLIDAAGLSPFGIEMVRHQGEPHSPMRIRRCRIRGYSAAGLALTAEGPEGVERQRDLIDVSASTFSGNEFWVSRNATRDSLIRVQTPLLEARQLRHPAVRTGRYRADWNAKVSRIKPFAAPGRPGRLSIRVASRSAL